MSNKFTEVYLRNLLRYSTVRIEASGPAGTSVGTASIFVAKGPSETLHCPFLVTNRHVVSGFDDFKFLFHAGDPSAVYRPGDLESAIIPPGRELIPFFSAKPIHGKPLELGLSAAGTLWDFHPDPMIDVAVMSLLPISAALRGANPVYAAPIAEVHIPDFKSGSFEAIEEVFFVGYPSGMYDVTNLTPIVRRGITATPMSLDYMGGPKFLVDASVFPGSSGSPVFISDSRLVTANPVFGRVNRHFFVGLISESFYRDETGEIASAPAPVKSGDTVTIKQMIDVGIVVKSTTVKEAVDHAMKKRGFPTMV
jgi:Trypsin-like peptidase domain